MTTELNLRSYAWNLLKGQPFADRTVDGAWMWCFGLQHTNKEEAKRFNPNPQQTWTQLMDKIVAELEAHGVAYVWAVHDSQNKVKEMHCIGANWLTPHFSTHSEYFQLPHVFSGNLQPGETWGPFAGWVICADQILQIKLQQQKEKPNEFASINNLHKQMQNQDQPKVNISEEELNSTLQTLGISLDEKEEKIHKDYVDECAKTIAQRDKFKNLLLECGLATLFFLAALIAALASFAYNSWLEKLSCTISAGVFTVLCMVMIHEVRDTLNE